MSRLLVGALLSLLAGYNSVRSQSPLERYRAAILRGQEPLAESLLPAARAGQDAAAQALLDAALLPPPERIAALLALARGTSDGRVIDLALVAGAAALAGADGCGSELELELPRGLSRAEAAVGFAGLCALLAQRQETPDADRACLDEARVLLARAGLVDVRPWTRVGTRTPLPVPVPLVEELAARWLPWDGSADPATAATPTALFPAVAVLRPGSLDLRIPAPQPGNHLLELRETRTGRRMLRPVLASDLRCVAHRLAQGGVALVRHGDAAAVGAELVLRVQDRGVERTQTVPADQDGLAAWTAPDPGFAALLASQGLDLFVRHDGHQATCDVAAPRAAGLHVEPVTWHLMVDRPVYRPGETVRGRVVVRSHWLRAGGAEPEVVSGPLVTRRIALRLWPDSDDELRLDLRTDALGVAAFELPLPAQAPLGAARLECSGERGDLAAVAWPFAVQEFRRAPLRLDVAAAPPADGQAVVTVSAQFASGAPAAGLPITVVAAVGDVEQRVAARLDDAGRARVPVRLDATDLPAGSVQVRVLAVAPDGQQLSEECTLGRQARAPRTRRGEPTSLELQTPEPRAGAPVTVVLHGPPGQWALLTARRQTLRQAQRIVLDGDGAATATIPTAPGDWPALELLATGLPASDDPAPAWTEALHVPLAAAHGARHVTVSGHERRFAPREAAELTVQVTDGAGQGVPAVVTLAVVDEAVFQRHADQTEDPRTALRPGFRIPDAAVGASAAPLPSLQVVGEMLEHGRLGRRWSTPGPSGPTTPGPAGFAGGGAVRSEFRATASFLPACATDAQGKATLRFTFPDDLARWRITVVAIDAQAGGARAVVHAETRLSLSVTPLLPRLLRTGDRVSVPVLVQRGAEVVGPATLRVGADGQHLAAEAPPEQVLAADQAGAHCAVVAGAPGRGELRVAVAAGAQDDAVRLAVPVLADVARTRVVTAAYADRAVTLPVPAPQGAGPVRATLALYGGRDALLAAAADFLQGYPHGCVEQTCSRLVPLFAAARARRLATGRGGVALDVAQTAALDVGMKRLRELLVQSDQGFAWWPRGAVDQGMTALVATALAQAREAGIEPATWGVRLSPATGSLGELAARLVRAEGRIGAKDGEVGVDQAELVIACLRLHPEAPSQRAAVQSLVQRDQLLPCGLLARAGLALARAGERGLAEQVLTRVLAGRGVLGAEAPGRRFPGESAAAMTAGQLELLLAVRPDHAARAGLVTRLLALGRDGVFDSTWATAAALGALLLDAELAGQAPDRTAVAVVVTQDGTRRDVELTPGNAFRSEVPLAGTGPVTVTPAAGRAVHAVLRVDADEPGATAAAQAQPIQLTRALVRVDRISGAVEPLALDQPIPAGELLLLRLRATAPYGVRYACLTCPLPAGFEVAGEPAGVEIRDHQVVVGCASLPAGGFEATVPLVAACAGNLAWPPAEVEAMYDPDLRGRTAGTRLRVAVKAGAASQPAPVVAQLTPAFFAERRARLSRAVDACTDHRELVELARWSWSAADRAAIAPALEGRARFFLSDPAAVAPLLALAGLPWEQAIARVRAGPASVVELLVALRGGPAPHALATARELVVRLLDGSATRALDAAQQRRLLWQESAVLLAEPLAVAAADGREPPAELVSGLLEPVRAALGAREAAFDAVLAGALLRLVRPADGSGPGWLERACAPFATELVARSAAWDPRPVVEQCPMRLLDALAGQLVTSADPGTAATVLGRWLGVALGLPEQETACLQLLDAFEDQPALLARVPEVLGRALDDPREDVRRTAFRVAPLDLKTARPEWLALSDDAWLGTAVWRVPSAEQQDWLRRRLVRDPDWIRSAGLDLATVRAALGAERFGALPLPVLAGWQDQPEIADLLVESGHGDAALAAELVRADAEAWRLALARACLRRGVGPAGLSADDPLAECLPWALRSRTGDGAAGDRLRVWLLEADPRHEPLRPLLAEALAPQLTLRELPRYRALYTDAQLARIQQRFGVAEWRELFHRAADLDAMALAEVPWPLAPELRDAALAVARRAPELRERIVDWILGTEGGLAFLRATVQREPDAVLAARIREQLRERIGAEPGGPEPGTFLTLLRLGALEPRTAAEQVALRQVLRRRALLLPGE